MGFIPCGFESHLAQYFMPHENRKKIILTADDFGKSELANKNILELAEAGKLDRVSVMVDGNFAPGEIEELISTGAKMDIHLELDWQKKRRGKMRDNTVKQGIVFLVNHFRASRREKICDVWQKQIEKFREFIGRYPDGVNSHEYVHFFPLYFRIAADLANRFKIPFVRFGKNGFRGKKNMAHLILNNLRRRDKKDFVASKLNSSDYFASLDWIGNIEKFLKNIPEGKTEIACHPEREEEYEKIKKYF